MDYILSSVYPDQLITLSKHIGRRQTDDLLIRIDVESFPYMEDEKKEEYLEYLHWKRDWLYDFEEEEEIDREGLDALKAELRGTGSKIGVAK